ncbi:low temperature requirement protein A [Atopomonas sediminilitoris]|uniref:low temperature requirement protein A n=1 Tax=Atopomonas sediminilitoris TaxID=2919919 RepID=UPI001F4E10F9|nr:low temperature requirement protein A [Atopomonas sediminilitoris]MCJ8169704.1 low temperature requirement protein A [Atopomonas sediminilitoris]
MLSTLYHAKERHATWLELFLDLVFVAVIGVIAHDLAHTHDGHLSVAQLLRFPLVFVPVWWIWMTHTVYANRFDQDSREHRLLSLVIMALLVMLSTVVEDSLGNGFALLALLYGTIRLLLALLYGLAYLRHTAQRERLKSITLAIALGGVISASAALIEGPLRYAVFYLGLAIDVLWQFCQRRQLDQLPIDRRHLVERIGLLAIIILGESMISMVAALNHEQWDGFDAGSAVAGFLLIGAIWWIYFDSFPLLERAKRLTNGYVLIFSHLFLCMGLLLLANMIRHAILGDLDQATFSLLGVSGLCLFYLGKQVPYWYAFAPWRRAIVGNTLVCVTITVASSFLPRVEYSLFGMMLGMLVYVALTFKRILSVDVSDDLSAH